MDMLELSELINAKFCHDLAGPIGAVQNGIELLEEMNENINQQAFKLIQMSIQQTTARLKFFRFIYGSSLKNHEIDLPFLKELTKDLIHSNNIQLDWALDNENNLMVPNIYGKMLLNVMYIAIQILFNSGRIKVNSHHSSDQIITTLFVENDKIRFTEVEANILKGNLPAENNTKTIQLYYTFLLSKHNNIKLETEFSEKNLLISIISPK